MHRHVARGIPRVLRAIDRPGETTESCYLDAIVTELFRDAAVAVCGTRDARPRTFRQRLNHNAPLPSELVTLFQLARSLRKRRNSNIVPVAA